MLTGFLVKVFTSEAFKYIAAQVAVSVLEKAVERKDNDVGKELVSAVKTAYNANQVGKPYNLK